MPKRKPLTHTQQEDAARLKAIWKEKRAAEKLSQADIEERTGIPIAMISHFMNAYTPLNIDCATLFAEALDISIADFSPTLAERVERATKVAKRDSIAEQDRLRTIAETATDQDFREALADYAEFLLLKKTQ